jgi:hypothetical protein
MSHKNSSSLEEKLKFEEEAIALKARVKETREENCKKKVQMRMKRT